MMVKFDHLLQVVLRDLTGGGGTKLTTGGTSKRAGGDMSSPVYYVKRGPELNTENSFFACNFPCILHFAVSFS
jgi:hypothetical protein